MPEDRLFRAARPAVVEQGDRPGDGLLETQAPERCGAPETAGGRPIRPAVQADVGEIGAEIVQQEWRKHLGLQVGAADSVAAWLRAAVEQWRARWVTR